MHMRPIFCHEQELLLRFSLCEFRGELTWRSEVAEDNIWGEHETHTSQIGVFNVNYRTTFSAHPLPENTVAKIVFIRPGYLLPALFVVAEEVTKEVYSIELLNGEQVGCGDYPFSISVIKACAAAVPDGGQWRKRLSWWRVFAMFDRVFFLISATDYSRTCFAERRRISLPAPHRGECFVLLEDGSPIGLDGWFEHPTGFGTDAIV